MPQNHPLAFLQLRKGHLMGVIGFLLLSALWWLNADGWFEPRRSQGFRFSVTIDYQGREIELARNVQCVWRGGGASGAGGGGGGGYRGVAYHNFGQIMPDGALVMVMVPGLCRFIDDMPRLGPNNTVIRDTPSWRDLPPKDQEMPLLFWAAKPEGFTEVIGFMAPEAYKGPYAKFQIKRWDAKPLPASRPRDFDPPDNYAAMGLVGPSDDRYMHRWNGKHRVGLPIPGQMIGPALIAYPPGLTLPFNPKYDTIAPWDPNMLFYNNNVPIAEDNRIEKFRSDLAKSSAKFDVFYGVSLLPESIYRNRYGLCYDKGIWRYVEQNLGVACFSPLSNKHLIPNEKVIIFGVSKTDYLAALPRPPPELKREPPSAKILYKGRLYGFGRFDEFQTGY